MPFCRSCRIFCSTCWSCPAIVSWRLSDILFLWLCRCCLIWSSISLVANMMYFLSVVRWELFDRFFHLSVGDIMYFLSVVRWELFDRFFHLSVGDIMYFLSVVGWELFDCFFHLSVGDIMYFLSVVGWELFDRFFHLSVGNMMYFLSAMWDLYTSIPLSHCCWV
jgi:hypothetical protein